MDVAGRFIDTAVGRFYVAANERGLVEVRLPGRLEGPIVGAPAAGGDQARLLEQFERELTDYLAGERTVLETPLDRRSTTPFLEAVYDACTAIPYGTVVTYSDLAERAGYPGRARAVGHAMATNPLPIVVPCHRVVGSNGSLTGYGGGIELKRWLLDLESDQQRLAL